MKKIKIPTSCEPSMYSTEMDMFEKIDHITVSDDKPDYTFNDVNVISTGCWKHIDGLLWVSGVCRGEHETIYNLIKEHNDIVIKGYNYKINELGKAISKNKYFEHAFRDFIDVKFEFKNKTGNILGIFIKELSEEFHQRLNILIKWCCDYASTNKYVGRFANKGSYAAYDIIRNNLDNTYFLELLETYTKEERKNIIEHTLERCKDLDERIGNTEYTANMSKLI